MLQNTSLMKSTFRQQFDKVDLQLSFLLERLEGYTHEELNRRPSPDKWSAMMVLQHLRLGEELSLKYLQKKLSFNPKLKKANFITYLRGFALRHYFKLPLKLKAPDIVSEVNFPEETTFQPFASEWLQLRKDLRAYLGTLDKDLFNCELYKHPIGGKMRLIDMLNFFEVHTRHHEKQILACLE